MDDRWISSVRVKRELHALLIVFPFGRVRTLVEPQCIDMPRGATCNGRLNHKRRAVIAEFDAGDTEAMLQAMAAQIVEYRRAIALLARAIGWAETGAPFALIATGPLWKPKPPRATSDSIDGIPTLE